MQVKLKGTHHDLKRQRLLNQSWRISAEQHLEVHLSYLMFHLVLCLTCTPQVKSQTFRPRLMGKRSA